MKFSYDPKKAANNKRKHGVSFDEAMTVFGDPLASSVPDSSHSEFEERWVVVGYSSMRRLLFVVYTDRGSCVRLIGARLATANERRQYEQSS